MLRLAKVADSQGNNREARILCDESTALFRQLGDKWSLAFALPIQWHIFLYKVDEATTRARLQESYALFEEVGDTWSIVEPLYSFGNFMYQLGRYAESRSYFETFLPLARELDLVWDIAAAQTVLADIAFAEGDYSEAEARDLEALSTWRNLGAKRFIARTLLHLAQLARARRDFVQATILFTESLRAVRESDPTDPMRNDTLAFCLSGLAALWAESGRAHEAINLLSVLRPLLREPDSEYVFIPYRRFGQSDYDRAVAAVRDRMDQAVFDAAREEGRARTLEQAIDYALPELERAKTEPGLINEKEQQKIGGLTRRERQVAILVGQGRSNREIAEQLVVSERTVENHISHIFLKLDFHSRTQIAMWAAKQGLLKNEL